ncbi:hypothetical protein [Rhodoferax sp.]|uniref:hypothetical protein n=1 Tax=Rhodoferax sp. TaxID=50421 RepID=UPI002777C695|nr:hypothetical protein [Rhodoferax sp.]
MRAFTPWLSEVPSQILRNGADRWMDAKTRQLKKLAKAPRPRNRGNFNSVLISSELFRFKDQVDASGQFSKVLELGTASGKVGVQPARQAESSHRETDHGHRQAHHPRGDAGMVVGPAQQAGNPQAIDAVHHQHAGGEAQAQGQWMIGGEAGKLAFFDR